MKQLKYFFSLMILAALPFSMNDAKAATRVSVVTGAFIRSIDVADLRYLVDTGIARGLLGDAIRLGGMKPAQVREMLNRSFAMSVVEIDELLRGELGTAILSRIGEVIFPPRAPQVGVPALRSAIIASLADDENLTPVELVEKYPTDIWIDLNGLFKLLEELKGMQES